MTRISIPLLICLIIIASISDCKASAQLQSFTENEQVKFPFERTIWTYWNSPNGVTPLIVQICFDNIEKVAKKYNFDFIVVNESTVRNYIANYDQQFLEVRKKSVQNTPAHAADLLRILLIEQQGGIWVDSTTIFLNGLGELENIMSQKYAHMVANRFSPQPDVLLFYYSQGQNRIQHRIQDPHNSSNTILYNPYPDYEIWMIAAKKNAPFIKEVRKTYQLWTTTDFSIVQQWLIQQDIYMHRIDNFNNYLYLNMVVSYVQQRKQAELDKSTSLTGQRYTAFEYYKLWGLHSEYGPMLTTRQDISPIQDLLEYSTKELQEEKGFKFLFFMKQFGYFRYVMGYKLDILIEIYENRNQTFEEFLASKPQGEWCQNITWLVQGSIMDEMIKNSRVSQKHRFPRITKAQNAKWKQYCQQNGSLFSYAKHLYSFYHIETLIISVFMPDKIHKAKVNSILAEGKDLSLVEWLKVKFDDNTFLLMDFGYLLFIVGIIWFSYNKMLKVFQKHVKKSCGDGRNVVNMDSNNEIHGHSSSVNMKPIRTASRPVHAVVPQWINQKQKLSIFTFLIFLSTVTLYNAVDVLGGLDQPETIFMFIVCIFILQSFMEHKFQQSGKKFIKHQQEYEVFYIMVNYMLAYLALCNMRKNRFWLNWFSMVLGMVGPCVMKLKREIDAFEASDRIETISQKTLPFWSFTQNNFRYLTVLLLSIPLILPNISFIAGEDGYYIKFIPTILTLFLTFIYIYVFIKCIYHKLYLEIARLVILVVICYIYTTYIPDVEFMIHNHPRILFIFREAVVIGVIYQLMGSELKFKDVEDVYFRESTIKKLGSYFGILAVEMLFGRLFFNVNVIFWTKWQFLQHWIILMYGVYLMALFSQFQRIKREKEKESIEYTEVQMDNLSQE